MLRVLACVRARVDPAVESSEVGRRGTNGTRWRRRLPPSVRAEFERAPVRVSTSFATPLLPGKQLVAICDGRCSLSLGGGLLGGCFGVTLESSWTGRVSLSDFLNHAEWRRSVTQRSRKRREFHLSQRFQSQQYYLQSHLRWRRRPCGLRLLDGVKILCHRRDVVPRTASASTGVDSPKAPRRAAAARRPPTICQADTAADGSANCSFSSVPM